MSDELFAWPPEEERREDKEAETDNMPCAHLSSALDFEEQNPFMIGNPEDDSEQSSSLFTRSNLLKTDSGFRGWDADLDKTGKSALSHPNQQS